MTAAVKWQSPPLLTSRGWGWWGGVCNLIRDQAQPQRPERSGPHELCLLFVHSLCSVFASVDLRDDFQVAAAANKYLFAFVLCSHGLRTLAEERNTIPHSVLLSGLGL